MLTALRSFRSQDIKNLIKQGTNEAQLLYSVDHPKEGLSEVHLKLTSQKKELFLNQTKITRFADFMGLFPTVVLSSEDLQLLRGAPGLRRRFIDLSLAAMDSSYFDDLRRYHRALLERNALLRKDSVSQDMLEAYNTILAPLAFSIYQKRLDFLNELNSLLTESYNAISKQNEDPQLTYKPDCSLSSSDDFLEILHSNFKRDCLFKSTQRGPHRDDAEFKIMGKHARQFASEGQQRGLVLALRLAQVQFCRQRSGVNPILLADDVLGQLDPTRSEAFWDALDPELQVIATGTELPDAVSRRDWQVFNVFNGTFSLQTPSATPCMT